MVEVGGKGMGERRTGLQGRDGGYQGGEQVLSGCSVNGFETSSHGIIGRLDY